VGSLNGIRNKRSLPRGIRTLYYRQHASVQLPSWRTPGTPQLHQTIVPANSSPQNKTPCPTNPPILILASIWSTSYTTSPSLDSPNRSHRDTIPPTLEEKITYSLPGLAKPECIHIWTRMFKIEHFIALVRLLCLHGRKERQKFV
jgi:hypothetical protein